MSNKIRTTIIALVASASLTTATVAPAVSQAAPKVGVIRMCSTGNGTYVPEGTEAIKYVDVTAPDGSTVRMKVTFECGSDGQWHQI